MFSSSSVRGHRGRALHPVRRVAFAALLAVGGLTATSASANAEVVYDNVPSPLEGNYISQAFQATQTSQFGGQIRLAEYRAPGPQHHRDDEQLGLSEDHRRRLRHRPGRDFHAPDHVNLYSVLPSGQPGGQIASVTETETIPYRPSTDPDLRAVGEPRRRLAPDGLAGLFLRHREQHHVRSVGPGHQFPDRVIVALAYQTSNYGKPRSARSPALRLPRVARTTR